jgi:hypothetical protein
VNFVDIRKEILYPKFRVLQMAVGRCDGAARGAAAARPGTWAQPEVVAVGASLRLLWQLARRWPSRWVCVGCLAGSGCGGVLCLGVLAGRCARGFSWAKALATAMPLGAASPVEGTVFLRYVFCGRTPGLSRTDDDGVPDVTPFLKASVLMFVSAML